MVIVVIHYVYRLLRMVACMIQLPCICNHMLQILLQVYIICNKHVFVHMLLNISLYFINKLSDRIQSLLQYM